jgi:predicted transcriptional regulator
MDVKATKLELVKMILDTEEESTLEQVKMILEESQNDWWDAIGDNEKAAIDEGISQLDRGEGIPHEEAMKKMKQKFNL